METIYQTIVKECGCDVGAFDKKNFLITFGHKTLVTLKDFCYFIDVTPLKKKIWAGDILKIDDQEYEILRIGEIASDATVASIGVALGRGTLISIILVLFVLPQILLMGDIIIEKTALTMNITRPQREVAGRVRVTGHVRGYVQGEIDADIQGTFQGQMKVSVDSVIPGRQGQIEQNDLDSQQISEDDDIADNKAQEGDEES